jgi:hypothetical protein
MTINAMDIQRRAAEIERAVAEHERLREEAEREVRRSVVPLLPSLEALRSSLRDVELALEAERQVSWHPASPLIDPLKPPPDPEPPGLIWT